LAAVKRPAKLIFVTATNLVSFSTRTFLHAISDQYTDTAGFTDHVFALCHLLGFRFAPRIRDLADKRLYVPDPHREYTALAPLVGPKKQRFWRRYSTISLRRNSRVARIRFEQKTLWAKIENRVDT